MSRLPRLTWSDSTSGIGNGAGRKTLSGARANLIASNDERNVARFPKLPNGTCSGRNRGRAREQSRVKIDGHRQFCPRAKRVVTKLSARRSFMRRRDPTSLFQSFAGCSISYLRFTQTKSAQNSAYGCAAKLSKSPPTRRGF